MIYDLDSQYYNQFTCCLTILQLNLDHGYRNI